MASLAAAWAARAADVPYVMAPMFVNGGSLGDAPLNARVGDDGALVILGACRVPASTALALARWILDTFADPDAAKEP